MESKKKVRFNLNENKILNMYVWPFAYQEARRSVAARNAADEYRFNLRKEEMEKMLNKIKFFSRYVYVFDLRQQKLESLLTEINFFSLDNKDK